MTLAKYFVILKGVKKVRFAIKLLPFCLVCLFVCLFVFVALRPKSTAMVITGQFT